MQAAPLAAQAKVHNRQSKQIENFVTEQLSVLGVVVAPTPGGRLGEYAVVIGARIFYQAAGDRPTFLLLHRYPLSGAMLGRARP